MKKYSLALFVSWQRIVFGVIAVITTTVVLLVHLSSLAPSLSPAERSTLAGSASLHDILANPLNLPLKIVLWLAQTIHNDNLLSARLPSVLLAIFSLIIFIYVLRRWYGRRSTIFGFSILLASAWFLHISRFAGTDIEYFAAILTVLAVYIGLYDHDRPYMVYCWLIVNLILLFIPGFVWFVLLSSIWHRDKFKNSWHMLKSVWQRTAWVALGVVGLAALGFELIRSPRLFLPWLGLPSHFASPVMLLRQLADTFSAFVYHGPFDPQLWLGRLPLLDAFLSLMLVIGLIFYAQHWKATRTRLLLSYILLGIVLVSLGGPVRLSVIVPIIFIVIVAGIAYILHFWLSVYPNNSLARTVGITVVSVAIGLSCFYNLQQYFVAWPHNPETVKVYRQP
ncbi:MAG: hypothetical protein ACREF5_02960 [Candidatus Saccharimonadales bacterium]